MSVEQKQVVWVVVTTRTQQDRLGLVQVFATEESAQRAAKEYNDAHPPKYRRETFFARVIRCEVK